MRTAGLQCDEECEKKTENITKTFQYYHIRFHIIMNLIFYPVV